MARRPWRRSASLRFAGGGGLTPLPESWPERPDLTRAALRPRLLTQPITLMRDLHCIRAGEVYFLGYRRPTGRLPIPRHPVVRSDKPELRQQLTDPKRVICLGSFFCGSFLAGLFCPWWRFSHSRLAAMPDREACLPMQAKRTPPLMREKAQPRAHAPSRPTDLRQPPTSTR